MSVKMNFEISRRDAPIRPNRIEMPFLQLVDSNFGVSKNNLLLSNKYNFRVSNNLPDLTRTELFVIIRCRHEFLLWNSCLD